MPLSLFNGDPKWEVVRGSGLIIFLIKANTEQYSLLGRLSCNEIALKKLYFNPPL